MKKIIKLLQSKWREYLIEVIVIIIGILLAIALNNWNEKRKEQAEEQIILKDLQSDFKDNLVQLQQKIENTQWSESSIEQIVQTLINKDVDSIGVKELALLHPALIVRASFDPKVGSWNELMSSGKLRLLQNKELRYRLSTWTSYLAEVKETETRVKETRDLTYDYLLNHFPMADLLSSGNNWRKISFKSSHTIDPSIIYKDIKFENILSIKSAWHVQLLRRYKVLEKEMKNISSLIEQEIK